jgi:hypothetical protein
MIMKKLIKFYKALGFIYGIVFTICLSSLVSFAATNLPGFAIFSQGGVVSSSEINGNFEKLAGNIVGAGTFTSSMNIINADFSQFTDSPAVYNYRKKMLFNNLTYSDPNLKTAQDPETASHSSSSGQSFTYYEVPSSGWYEISVIPEFTIGVANQVCTGPSCQYNLYGSTNIILAKNFASLKWDNGMVLGVSKSKFERDMNMDSVFDEVNNWEGNPPESRKLYLKAGQILYIRTDASYNNTSTTADYEINYPANSIQFKIVKF